MDYPPFIRLVGDVPECFLFNLEMAILYNVLYGVFHHFVLLAREGDSMDLNGKE